MMSTPSLNVVETSIDRERRSRLLSIKLAALVRDHHAADTVGADGSVPTDMAVAFGRGAAIAAHGQAWVLLDESPQRGLGPALAWARRAGQVRVNVIADHETGVLARRAELIGGPIEVWHADGRVLLPAIAEPFAEKIPVPAAHESFRQTIIDAGAIPGVEHGVLYGEVAGLEVCRVVHDPFLEIDRLEVGVGAHDREAFQIMHGDRPTAEALASVVAFVEPHRRVDADPHPLSRLAAERLLRWRIITEPSMIGFDDCVAAQPPVPRPNLKDPTPCVAVGHRRGEPCVVVCSAGIDLDVVPFAVDARAALIDAGEHDGVHANSPLIIVVAKRDVIASTEALADAVGATIVPIG